MNIKLDIVLKIGSLKIISYASVCLTETTHNLYLPEKHVLNLPNLTIIYLNHQQ